MGRKEAEYTEQNKYLPVAADKKLFFLLFFFFLINQMYSPFIQIRTPSLGQIQLSFSRRGETLSCFLVCWEAGREQGLNIRSWNQLGLARGLLPSSAFLGKSSQKGAQQCLALIESSVSTLKATPLASVSCDQPGVYWKFQVNSSTWFVVSQLLFSFAEYIVLNICLG